MSYELKDITGEVQTFAKHMICPEHIIHLKAHELPKQGIADFGEYQFSEVNNKAIVTTKVNALIDEIISALKAKLIPTKEPVLLLSDGKDSMMLAIALAKMEVRCKTLTLLRNNDDELKEFVKSKSLELGHTPYFVNVDEIFENYDKELFLNACKKMKNPVLDQGFLFFLFGIKGFYNKSGLNANECQFIDGLGNDEYLGYLPSKPQLKAFTLSKFNLWKLIPNRVSWLRWYFRSPAEAQGDLSALSCFYKFSNALDLNSYFSKIPKSNDSEYIDFRAFSRGKFHDHQCMIGKTKAAANSFGSDIIYPWTDKNLSLFCFNLPSVEKYDFDELKNKICLRSYLEKEISWKQDKRGVDLFFDINIDILKLLLDDFIDYKNYKHILERGYLPSSVRKRALLELLNLCGYLSVNNYDRTQIKSILGDF